MLWNAHNGSVAVGGSSMSYVCFGHGAKSFAILPGLSDGLATVKGKALLLAKPYERFFDNYTVYMFSRRDKLERGCTMREMAEDQAAALRALGMKQACVMGVSQGGMIAQWLAIDHPELVEKLVLAVTAARSSQMARDCITAWTEMARRGDHKALMIDTAERSYSPEKLKEYRKLYPVIGMVGRPRSYERFFANTEAILAFDTLDELGRITCPTLILAGRDDKIVGVEASEELHERIAGSELYIYEGLGHAAYEEAPDFNERVFRFLEEQQWTE